MAEKEKKPDRLKLISRKVLQGLLIGLIAGAVAVLAGFFGFSKNLELMTLDLRYRLRPRIQTLPEVGFIDYDDSSLELFGEWPWPRMRQVALVRTLGFYNARMAGYDVFFLERENTIFHPDRLKRSILNVPGRPATPQSIDMLNLIDNSFENYDREFAEAMKRANNIYIAYYASDPDERVSSKVLKDILKETEQTRSGFSEAKKEAMRQLEKTFLQVPKGVEKYLYKTTDFDPPVPDLAQAAKGVGFAQPGIDEDSVKRNYMFFRYYNKQMLYSITLKMLSDIMDFRLSEVEVHPGEYILLKNALDYRTKKRKDLRVPVDEHCQTLLNWAGTFHDTYFHVPFRLLSYYYAYNTAREIARQYPLSGPAAFDTLRGRILDRITEEGMTAKEDADRIAREVAAAWVITRAFSSRPSATGAEIFRKLEGRLDRDLFERVFYVVSEGMRMEKALSADPSLTFENFKSQISNLKVKARPEESHLREVFKNIKFFAEKKRLKEAQPYYFPPARQVLSNGRPADFSPVDLENKIFMVGLTGTNTIDLQPTPFEENCPLVALHVNAINTILTGNFLHHPPKSYKYAATVLMSLLVGIIGVFFTIQISFLLTVLSTGGYLLATYKVWEAQGYWLDWVAPLAGVLFTYMTIVVMQFVKAFLEKKKVRGIFAMMVSPAVLKVMEENPDKFSLTGERKPATMLFSMINGIGNITKTVAPDELTSLLSIYLTPNSEIIMDYDGYIDKYEGHVIMADFGVPLDDENNPWKCAFSTIEQRIDIEAFKHFVAAKYGLKVGVSMGFNYGYVSAGNMGSERKFQYTVMGDPVNVSARFMASNFIYNSVYSITGEDTVPVIRDYVYLRPLDKVLLKGKTKPTAIFNVTGWKPDAYLKLRGDRPVPDFLGSLWTKCPPEKIFGYQRLWTRMQARTGHPMAGDIREFFVKNLDTASVLLTNGWKKEIAEYSGRIELLKADILANLNITVDHPSTGSGDDFRQVLGDWTSVLRKALEALGENTEKAKSDRALEVFLEQAAHSARLLINKIEMLLFRLEQEIPAGALDERIEESTREIKSFIPLAHQSEPGGFESVITGNMKKYRDAAEEFNKSIANRKKEYHEMMSIAGSPTDDELAASRYFEEGLALYWQRAWDASLEKFRSASKLTGDRGPVRSLIERIESYKVTPPGEKWQGEFVQTKK